MLCAHSFLYRHSRPTSLANAFAVVVFSSALLLASSGASAAPARPKATTVKAINETSAKAQTVSPATALPRIFACSNQSFAQGLTVVSNSNSIRESRKVVYFNEDLTDLVLGYANYYIGSTGENNTGQGNVNVRFGLEYQGHFYPFLINGQRTALCVDGTTIATDPLTVNITAGTYGAIRMREQKTNPGVSSNSWLWSTDGDTAFSEGTVTHSDPNRDWTLGGAPGETATLSWTIDSNGAVTTTVVASGSGITASGVSIGILDSQRTGSGFSWVYTVKSGGLGSTYQKTNGSGYSQDTWMAPCGMGGYGSGGNQQSHGPCVIAGTPATARTSILLLGDSIAAGYGSADSRGDIWRNFGIYARSMSNTYNVCNTAIPGLTAYACDYGYARSRALIASILKPQVVMICLGTNDVDQSITDSGSKTVTAALAGHLNSLATWWNTNCGSKIWFGTILPREKSSTDGFTTLAGQTIEPGFAAGGNADIINAALRANTIYPASSRLIDGRALVQDPGDNNKWRVDHGALTNDGTHPSDAIGIPWVVTNLSDLGDPDHDGFSNLMEYALGTNPEAPNPGSTIQTTTAGGSLALVFPRNTNAADLTLAVQGAASVSGSWTNLATSTAGSPFTAAISGVAVAETGTGATVGVTVTDQYTMHDPAHPTRFLRLTVEH